MTEEVAVSFEKKYGSFLFIKDSKNITSYIDSISALGLVDVIFNATMDPADLVMYNTSNIFIYLEKYDDDEMKHL